MKKTRNVVMVWFVGLSTLWAAKTGMVSGFVRDATNGEFMEYVNVYLADGSVGTATNNDGYYALTGVPEDKHTLVISMIGYREEKPAIELKAGTRLRKDIYLKRGTIEMAGVEITIERTRFEHDVDIGVQRMNFTELTQVPGFVEQDIFQSLQMLPGIVSVSDISSALYVRGGTMDQNQVLLDGVTVYNPYHMGGLFSTFILESLKGTELYTGGFPSRYGGAISSVLDVEMKAGNSERRKTVPLDESIPQQGPGLDEKHEEKKRTQIVRQAVNDLPGTQRMALVLSKFQGRSYKEVAEIMEVSLSSVESLIFRAKENLKKKLLPLRERGVI